MPDETERTASAAHTETATTAGSDAAPICPCGIASQPWKSRDALFSPASVFAGLFLVALVVALATANERPSVAGAAIGVVAGVALVAMIVQAVKGHRGWCLVRRALWFGIAVPGLPVRIVAAFP